MLDLCELVVPDDISDCVVVSVMVHYINGKHKSVNRHAICLANSQDGTAHAWRSSRHV